MNAFFIGLQFLTRLKLVTQTEWNMEDFGHSVKYFPIVGAVVGLFMVVLYLLLEGTLKVELIMAIMVVFEFLFTGGIHADGFMDTCDGLFSGRDRERKLEIMKDSRVGSNGVVGFVFLVLLKWQLLSNIPTDFIVPVLFIMPTLSRYTMSLSVKCYPYARPEGMGKAFAIYSPENTVLVATLFALLPLIWHPLLYGISSIWMLFLNRIMNRYMVKHLGGVTGDTYGFVCEVSEVLLLVLLCIILPFISTYTITTYQIIM